MLVLLQDKHVLLVCNKYLFPTQLSTDIILWLPVCGTNELTLLKELTKKPEQVSELIALMLCVCYVTLLHIN